MPFVGFERTIPVFKGAKTVHALHRAATVIGCFFMLLQSKKQKTLYHFAQNIY
jgi:hypothetical protein